MILHLPDVVGQLAAAHAVFRRRLRVEERLERRLRIDDDAAAAGEVDGHVGAEPAALRKDGRLLVEVAVLEHAGELHDFAQLHFTPLPAHARRAQRADQVLRFLLQLLLRVPDEAEHRAHARAVVDARLLDFLQLRIHLLQRVFDRRDQGAELLLPPGQIDRGFAVDVADLLIRELQKLIRGGLERGRGQRLEGFTQLLFVRGAAPGGQQPAGGEAGRQGDHNTDSEFQFLQFSAALRNLIRFT